MTREHRIYHGLSLTPFLDRVAADNRGGLAVDLGCGTGAVTIELARRGFRVIGVDHSPHMLDVAGAKLADEGLAERVELRLADLEDAGLPEGEAAVVTCQGVLHHLPDMRPCIEAMARTLRPGGRFYISEPCADANPVGRVITAIVHGLVAARERLRGRRSGHSTPESPEAPVRSEELLRLLDLNGLTYERTFATHVPMAHHVLGDRLRRALTVAISRPWRRRRGDLVFIEGTKPGAEPAS